MPPSASSGNRGTFYPRQEFARVKSQSNKAGSWFRLRTSFRPNDQPEHLGMERSGMPSMFKAVVGNLGIWTHASLVGFSRLVSCALSGGVRKFARLRSLCMVMLAVSGNLPSVSPSGVLPASLPSVSGSSSLVQVSLRSP